MSLLISTSTGGWAGSQRGGDHNSIHLKSHFMEAWPLISKSGQNMCKGRAKVLAQAGGRGTDRQDDIVPAQRVQRRKEPCTLTPNSHLRAVSRPCPLSPSTSQPWRNATATSSTSVKSPTNWENFLRQVCRFQEWGLEETAQGKHR